jgi:hypothetical protein
VDLHGVVHNWKFVVIKNGQRKRQNMDINLLATYTWVEGLHSTNWRQELNNAVQRRIGREPTTLDIRYETIEDENRERYTTTLEVMIDGTVYCYEGVPQLTRTLAIRCGSWMALVDLHQKHILQSERSFTTTKSDI